MAQFRTFPFLLKKIVCRYSFDTYIHPNHFLYLNIQSLSSWLISSYRTLWTWIVQSSMKLHLLLIQWFLPPKCCCCHHHDLLTVCRILLDLPPVLSLQYIFFDRHYSLGGKVRTFIKEKITFTKITCSTTNLNNQSISLSNSTSAFQFWLNFLIVL